MPTKGSACVASTVSIRHCGRRCLPHFHLADGGRQVAAEAIGVTRRTAPSALAAPAQGVVFNPVSQLPVRPAAWQRGTRGSTGVAGVITEWLDLHPGERNLGHQKRVPFYHIDSHTETEVGLLALQHHVHMHMHAHTHTQYTHTLRTLAGTPGTVWPYPEAHLGT